MDVSSSRGFVLVASIWLTLILLLLAGLFSAYAGTRFDEAVTAKVRTQDRVDSFSTEQVLLYLMATGVTGRNGLSTGSGDSEFLGMDGNLYSGVGDSYFELNDLGGLVGINSLNNVHLANLLSQFESDPLVRNSLLDSLYDYIDLNDSPRLSGNEAAAYRVADKPLPANDYLKSSEELRRVYGWNNWLRAHPEFDLAWLSPNWRSRLNLNSVPEDLLRHVLPLPAQDKELLIEARREHPFKNYSEVERLLNMRSNLDADFYTFLPLDRVRMRIYSKNNAKLQTIFITNSPLSTSSPWVIESRYQSERHFNIRGPVRSVAAEFFSG